MPLFKEFLGLGIGIETAIPKFKLILNQSWIRDNMKYQLASFFNKVNSMI